ncbi:MAG: hypothetical protein WC307_06675 [Candidatus Nanoarchaeia archaeon]|jgi:hypothetical protein
MSVTSQLVRATNKILGIFKVPMVWVTYSTPAQDTYDNVSYSSVTSNIYGALIIATAETAQASNGRINEGDVMAYLDNTVSPKENDMLTINSINYSIKQVMPRYMDASTTKVFTVCKLVPIQRTSL